MITKEELINLFGNNYNSLDNLVKYLNGKYHPKYFKNFKEFCTSLNIRNQSVDEYTDDYISENDSYLVILFDDYRDFENASEKDKICGDVVISYNKDTRKIVKYFYTTSFNFINNPLKDIEMFYNN